MFTPTALPSTVHHLWSRQPQTRPPVQVPGVPAHTSHLRWFDRTGDHPTHTHPLEAYTSAEPGAREAPSTAEPPLSAELHARIARIQQIRRWGQDTVPLGLAHTGGSQQRCVLYPENLELGEMDSGVDLNTASGLSLHMASGSMPHSSSLQLHMGFDEVDLDGEVIDHDHDVYE